MCEALETFGMRNVDGMRNQAAPLSRISAGSFHRPTSLGELLALRAELPGARLIAGATELGLS
jgi:xanthine dehydrogenase iron-sulfur cluster and FAD-binding subunit A